MIQEMRIALRNAGKINPNSIEEYIQAGGYEALEKARKIDSKELIDIVEKSGGLRGRGGAGFSTGFKWSSAHSVDSEIKYVVCNADEGEPGTYKDRAIMENDPHTIIEGMLIAAYAIGAKHAYIYCRGEYEESIRLLRNACKQAEEKGISKDVCLKVVSGAGAYVCGEETALINSLEGKRGEPRLKPPFPTIAGYNAKPTVVNNVETFAMVPQIVKNGGEWFRSIGTATYPGTKIFSLSGDVENKTVFELPTNANLKDLIYDLGGGIPNGRKLKAVQLGGSSCAFLTPDQIDISIDFESVRAAGGALGSGALLVIDDSHNIVDILAPIAHFFNHESCGKCVPCREGTFRVAQALDKIVSGKGSKEDLNIITRLSEHMEQSCFCALGQSATIAVASAMKLFPEDFEAKLNVQEV